MKDFMFEQLKRLDKYDTMSQRSRVRPNPMSKPAPMPGPSPLNRPEFGHLEHQEEPLGFEDWLSNQPYGGQISPFQPQGTDFWQEQYNDYLRGWESKFGEGQGMGGGMGNSGYGSQMGPGSGGPRDMGTPSMGNLLRGKPNKSY
ncbi:MAG: hypothetical protein Tp152DCM46671_61 [Prokaryotic dsDNA virus sp.]|nr:MAG: hypothetical protein Tp152DCM46671_61 [Prokaryotic dsDNA virus sp.]|tara:strand:- start:52467 stop:52898 length:432 start_codon:yes stop_codon:yes gene_type:complete